MISTTNNYQKLQARAQNVYVFISGCRSLSQSFGVSFFRLRSIKPVKSISRLSYLAIQLEKSKKKIETKFMSV